MMVYKDNSKWYFGLFIACVLLAWVAALGVVFHHPRFMWGGIILQVLCLLAMAVRLLMED